MNLLREKHRLMPYAGWRIIVENDAPDTSRADATAQQMADLSKEQLQWTKDLYGEWKPQLLRAAERQNAISDAQLNQMNTATRLAADADTYNKTVFRPLETSIVNEAQNFDTEANQQAAAGRAVADVRAGFAGQRDMAQRQQTRMGVNPSDGASAVALNGVLDSAEALGTAGAATRAREGVKTMGRAMRMDAVSLGRNLPSQQATQAGLALQAGGSSANTIALPTAGMTAGANVVNSGTSVALGGLGTAGNIFQGSNRIQQQAAGDGGLGALGNIAGRGLQAWIMKS